MEELSISSFLYHGHEYHLYVYDEITVPKGTTLKDANEIIHEKHLFKDNMESYVCYSDTFRYKLLLENGGYWVDTDMICLKSLDFKSEYVFAGERTEYGSEERNIYGTQWVNGCVTKVPPGSDIMNYCYNMSKKKEFDRSTLKGWELGPPIISDGVNKFKLNDYVLSHIRFNPIDWWGWREILSDKLSVRIKLRIKLIGNVYGIHLWSSMWNREKTDKNHKYHQSCLYERLKKRYLNL